MFESRKKPVISRREYLRRLAINALLSVALVAFSLAVGTVGYHVTAGISWVDAFYNASMILTGMGPIAQLTTNAAKLFASFYALFSGIAFLGTISIVLAPIIHRAMHKFHIDDEE